MLKPQINISQIRFSVILAVIYGLHIGLYGCVTTGGSIQTSYTKISQLQEADRFFDKAQYQTALLKYSSYIYAPFPDKKHEDYALYKLGLCQFLLGQYHDAQKTTQSLLQKYPNFEYHSQAKDLLARCDQKIVERNQTLALQWGELVKNIQEQEQRITQEPNNARNEFQLGDLYWRAGRYEDAVKQYERAVKLDKNYLENKTLIDRVRITEKGEFHVRDPLYENIQKSSPVRVVQVNRERIVREDYLGQYESIRLSGFVENAGLYDVNNVRIELSLYDFYGTVQETQIVAIGKLQAGGKRPFSALFNQYRGLGIDITRYTTEVYYDAPAGIQ